MYHCDLLTCPTVLFKSTLKVKISVKLAQNKVEFKTQKYFILSFDLNQFKGYFDLSNSHVHIVHTHC